jgi:hypothetical protein
MSGFIRKTNFWMVLKTFGTLAAVKMLLSREKTFLDFCMKNEIF